MTGTEIPLDSVNMISLRSLRRVRRGDLPGRQEIPIGATAPEAAGVIHTDFQRGFIKAEIVSFGDLMAAGSVAAARAAGKVRIEDKEPLKLSYRR